MDENIDRSSRLSHADLKSLMARRNLPGLLLFSLQSLLFMLLSVATVRLSAAGSSLSFVAVFFDGLVLLTFFASMHEAGHGTAFASAWMNRAVLWVSAVLMLQSPIWIVAFVMGNVNKAKQNVHRYQHDKSETDLPRQTPAARSSFVR